MTLEIQSSSPADTHRLGEAIGRILAGGEVIGLDGDLGAGKTCLVRGIAVGLDIDPDLVYSPTFTLVAEHTGRLHLNHVDLFRLADPISPEDAHEIGLDEYVASHGVTVIEWYEKLARSGGTIATLHVAIAVEGEERRSIRIEALEEGSFALLGDIEAAAGGIRG
ncbi:MAG: tRNA threonylcarbamoyladenosine biosynthesis protein TsaE [Candidatus Binatota bacterium]|jgi:tRNA threonylcarbamoyladenosine biosynthesis protein TsaE|nr:tRNA threonylcarbamoyladenosine biosynthesis protein TsaE [Candidatus Binatota bacterium]